MSSRTEYYPPLGDEETENLALDKIRTYITLGVLLNHKVASSVMFICEMSIVISGLSNGLFISLKLIIYILIREC